MEIRNIQLSELNPAVYNPRKALKPGDAEFEKLKKSIETFGYVELIVVNKRTGNTVVSGHQRLSVLKHLGKTEAECIVVDMSEQDEKALNVAMNKIGGEWDAEALTKLLQGLSSDGYDTTLTGFEISEMTEMFDEASDIKEDTPDEPDFENETIVKSGDIWKLGSHRLMCGDSTSKKDVSFLVDGQVIDLLATDPPYNVDYQGKTVDKLKIVNDSMDDGEFKTFLRSAFDAARSVMRKGAAYYIWHPGGETGSFWNECEPTLGKPKQIIIWKKNTFVLGRQDYQWQHEPCLYGWIEGKAHYFCSDRSLSTVFDDKVVNLEKMSKADLKKLVRELMEPKTQTTVIEENKPLRSAEHPTMKPVKLIARTIRNSSRIGDAVLDLFGGSGTTLIACEQLGRRCYTMELDPHYCDVIVRRWEKLTGEKAELICK